MNRLAAVAAAIISLASAAPAAAAGASLSGVWDGTVGELPVRVCLDDSDPENSYGAYFYRSKLQTIPLIADDEDRSLFSEGWPDDAKVPRWRISPQGADQLAGTWTEGKRNLPVRLARVALADSDDPCGSLEFEQPRLQGLRIVRSPAARDGVAYETLTLDDRGHFGDQLDVQSFELRGNDPSIAAVNAALKKPFDEKGDDSWLSCMRAAYPWGGDYHEMLEPRMISSRWLVVNDHWDGSCGGAHPDSSNHSRTFDLTTGREIDALEWFTTAAVEGEQYDGDADVTRTLQPSFRRFLIGHIRAGKECSQAIESEEFWNVELTRTGFTFTPILAHVVQACEQDFNLPFAKAARYLTAEGRAVVAELEAERVSRR